MDRETLIAAKEAAWLKSATYYRDCSGIGVDKAHTPKEAWMSGFDAALSLLQWKDVADGLPEVEGQYSVVKGSGKTPFYLTFPKAEDKSAYAQIVRMMWAEEIAAYIPVPIPEWKEQR